MKNLKLSKIMPLALSLALLCGLAMPVFALAAGGAPQASSVVISQGANAPIISSLPTSEIASEPASEIVAPPASEIASMPESAPSASLPESTPQSEASTTQSEGMPRAAVIGTNTDDLENNGANADKLESNGSLAAENLAKSINLFEHDNTGTKALTATASGDGKTVTVTGTASGAVNLLSLDIAAGITVVWKADYTGAINESDEGFRYLLNITGDGVFEVAAGGKVSNVGRHCLVINAYGTQTSPVINVTGGAVTATGDKSYAIYANGEKSIVNVTSGTVKSDGEESYAIWAVGASSIVNVNGGEVKADGKFGIAIFASGTDSIVNVDGGTVSADGQSDHAIYANGETSTVNVSGGTVKAKTAGYAIYISDFAQSAKIFVLGGTVQNGNPLVADGSINKASSNAAKGYYLGERINLFATSFTDAQKISLEPKFTVAYDGADYTYSPTTAVDSVTATLSDELTTIAEIIVNNALGTASVATKTVVFSGVQNDTNVSLTVRGEIGEMPVEFTTTAFGINVDNYTVNATMNGGVYNGSIFAYNGAAVTKTSDGSAVTNPTLTAVYSGINGTAYPMAAQAPTNVGSYRLSLTAEKDGLSGIGVFEFEITPKALAIKADDKTVGQSAAMPAFTYTATGFVAADALLTPPTFATAADTGTSGTFAIVPSGAAANSNYAIAYVNGTLTITAAPIALPTEPNEPNEPTAKPAVTKVKFGQSAVTLVAKKAYTPAVSIYITGTQKDKLKWKTSNAKIAKVSANGKITAGKKGKAKITATATNGKKAVIAVTVIAKAPAKNSKAAKIKTVKASVPKSMKVKTVKDITGSASPATVPNMKVTYKSSNAKIASIDKAGRITAKKAGKVKITIKAGGVRKTYALTIKK